MCRLGGSTRVVHHSRDGGTYIGEASRTGCAGFAGCCLGLDAGCRPAERPKIGGGANEREGQWDLALE